MKPNHHLRRKSFFIWMSSKEVSTGASSISDDVSLLAVGASFASELHIQRFLNFNFPFLNAAGASIDPWRTIQRK